MLELKFHCLDSIPIYRSKAHGSNCDKLSFVNRFSFEKLHHKFCKAVLGIKKTSCNISEKSELGRLPLDSFINGIQSDGINPLSNIWGRTKSYLRWIVRWIGPLRMTGSDMTESDVSHVTGSDHVRKYVLRMRNRKLRNIRPSGALLTGSDTVT